MAPGVQIVGFRQNNDDLSLHSCSGFSAITVTNQQQRATTFNPVNAAHFLSSRVTFPLALQRDNCWSRDAETGAPQSALEEGEAKGKEGVSGRKGEGRNPGGTSQHVWTQSRKRLFWSSKWRSFPPTPGEQVGEEQMDLKETGKLKCSSLSRSPHVAPCASYLAGNSPPPPHMIRILFLVPDFNFLFSPAWFLLMTVARSVLQPGPVKGLLPYVQSFCVCLFDCDASAGERISAQCLKRCFTLQLFQASHWSSTGN